VIDTASRIAAVLLLSLGAAVAAPEAVDAPQRVDARAAVDYGRFGPISIERGTGEPRDIVLFLSGDGGWNLGVVSMARRLADKGAIVAGIDIRHYLAQLEKSSETCVSPAADFDNLSRYLQAKLGLEHYLQPTLVGYSSCATLVYATLVEAPDGLFKGALSIAFCPDLDLKKPLCKGSGIEASPRRDAKGQLQGVNFLPAKKLSGKWISLQGEIDQVCPAPATQEFIAAVPGAGIVMLPKVGHGYSVEKNWIPQYEAAYERITAAPR
jgi:type IV secretory pathway VirJ component